MMVVKVFFGFFLALNWQNASTFRPFVDHLISSGAIFVSF